MFCVPSSTAPASICKRMFDVRLIALVRYVPARKIRVQPPALSHAATALRKAGALLGEAFEPPKLSMNKGLDCGGGI